MSLKNLSRTIDYLSSEFNRACNQDLEDHIALKLNNLCKKYGEIQYEIIEHTNVISYNDLSILEKKKLINSLCGTVAINRLNRNMIYVPIIDKESAHKLLSSYDNSLGSRKSHKGNLLLSNNIGYYKFKINNNYLDVNKLVNEPILLEYLQTKVSRHAIINGYKLPLVDIHNQDNYERTIKIIYNTFTKEELNYM